MGLAWTTLRSSQVTCVEAEEFTSQWAEPHGAWPALWRSSRQSALTMLASPWAHSYFLTL